MDDFEPVLTDVPPAFEAVPAEPEVAPAAAPHRRRRWPKRLLIAVAALVVLLVAFYGAALYDVWSTGNHDQARPVDVIVVLGAAQYDGRPSPQLASRLDHALELYERGLASHVFVTGGKQPLDRFTEAASSARYLEDRGVPESAIMREDEGRTSWDSLAAVANTMKQQDLHSVLLVSDPFHLARIKGMAEELGLEAYVSPTRTSPVTGAEAFKRELEEAAGVAAARVVGWDRLMSWTD